MWEIIPLNVFYAEINFCTKAGFSPDYQMNMISKKYKYRIIPMERIITGTNVKHSCIGGKCQEIERKLAISHHSPEHHRVVGNIQRHPITDQMFEEALKVGKDVWDRLE
ncbi:hypothetical protein VP01_11199g1, partial [Puccinia sorghi]